MRLNASLACALVSGMLSAIVPAAPPTSPETKAEMISRIDALEKKPYDPAARDAADRDDLADRRAGCQRHHLLRAAG